MTAVDRLAQLRNRIGKEGTLPFIDEMQETTVNEERPTEVTSVASGVSIQSALSVQSPHLRNRADAPVAPAKKEKPRWKSFYSAAIERCLLKKKCDQAAATRRDQHHTAPLPDSMASVEQDLSVAEIPQQNAVPKQIPGWVSPNYSSSRSVKLSPAAVLANRGIMFEGASATVDAYKILRTQILQRLQQTGGRTIMITSAVPGEGKTTTAINLAFTFAREFQQTVLLVDCDLQQQRIHQYLGYESDKGLINYLLDDCPVNELFTWPGIEKITLISGGRTFSESSEILGAPRMRELIDNMKFRYPERYVFFDVQSILSGSDALVFAPMVDHVLLVVEEGKTSINDIKKTVAMLPEGKLLGMVLNRHRPAR